MFYPSSRHHFDTMFVILCVIAGATSHTISNTSKTPINQLDNHYRTSFMAFILDSRLSKLLQSTNSIRKDLSMHDSSEQESAERKLHHRFQTVCTLLSNLLSGNQMKFCLRHQDILETILPQVIQLTKKECSRITSSLRWNCSMIDIFLDRSNPLAFTKEAALVRSILNASMMYLVVKTCSEASYSSCGCQYNHRYSISVNAAAKVTRCTHDMYSPEEEHSDSSNTSETSILSIDQQDLSSNDLTKLDAGSPLRLTKSVTHQVCLSNAFASTMSKIFLDSDDTRALNKAYKILNEDQRTGKSGNRRSFRHLIDSDYKDLAYIKWTKSAVNLHNNYLGRQLVREATQRRCRCHGVSGVCQYQTCWDQLNDFDTITSRLKSIYLSKSVKVELKNLGTLEKPDLYLSRLNTSSSDSLSNVALEINLKLPIFNNLALVHQDSLTMSASDNQNELDRINSGELIYLYKSPNYCDAHPIMRHLGTRGRQCTPLNNVTITRKTSKKSVKEADDLEEVKYIEVRQEGLGDALGSCEQLCCNRGYRSELILDMVSCSCRFRFCCKVDCEHCLRQKVQHYCL